MIRFGVIGTNWITDRLLTAAKEHQEFKLTAVYSRTEEKAKEFAEKHGASLIYTNIEEFAKSEEIDAVYIASPNSLHSEQAIQLMNNGKHILCEKPIASNVKELEEMIEAATRNQVLLMEAMKTTLLPNFKSIQENLHKIGKIRRYVASFCKYSSRYDAYKQGTILNAFNPTFSNGSLMDLGVYCIYPMVVLFGKPKTIKAEAIMLESGVDGAGSVLMEYEEMEAIISHSKITDSYLPSEIQGENGTILLDKISEPERVEIRYKDGTVENIGQSNEHSPMFYEVKEFIDLIKNGQYESSINSYNHSRITTGIIEEARKQFGLIYPADI
jgi:predicted dehydrogenase